MSKSISPCKDCTKHSESCHSSCDQYKEWKSQHDSERDRRYKKRYEEYLIHEDIDNARKRMKTKRASNRFK